MRHIQTAAHQTGRVLAFFAVDLRVSCFYRDSYAKKAAAFFKKSVSKRASRSSALIFLYSASWAAVISSPSVPEWIFLHLFTQHPHGLRDQNCRTLPPR